MKYTLLLFLLSFIAVGCFADVPKNNCAYKHSHSIKKLKKTKPKTNNKKKELEKKKEEPQRRALPAPFDEIFPATEYLGPTIGVPNSNTEYPLTKLFWKLYPGLKENKIYLYGWFNPSFNLSTSKDSNIPLGFDIVPNRVNVDELVLRIERNPDTVQTDHIDWGFRFTNYLGIDYRFSTMQGLFSNQLLQHNNLYGYDLVEAYGQIYFPCVAQGMVITIGRYLAPPDFESPLAPEMFLFTHSLLNTYDASSFMGITSTIKLNDHWSVLLGIHGGSDIAVWDGGAHPSAQALIRWVSCSNNDSIWTGVTSFNGGRFKNHHDNLQEFNLTWTHRFNPCFFTATELTYMYQRDARLGGTCNFGPVRDFGDGGGCGDPIPGFSAEFAAINFLVLKVTKHDFVAFRTDYMDDQYGERTGYKTQYMTYTLGFTHEFSELFRVRPEIRYDRAFSAHPYDNGRQNHQICFGVDAVLRF